MTSDIVICYGSFRLDGLTSESLVITYVGNFLFSIKMGHFMGVLMLPVSFHILTLF